MHVRMELPAGVRAGRVARAAYAVRASGRKSAVKRIDGCLVRITMLGDSGRKEAGAKAVALLRAPKVLPPELGAALKARLSAAA